VLSDKAAAVATPKHCIECLSTAKGPLNKEEPASSVQLHDVILVDQHDQYVNSHRRSDRRTHSPKGLIRFRNLVVSCYSGCWIETISLAVRPHGTKIREGCVLRHSPTHTPARHAGEGVDSAEQKILARTWQIIQCDLLSCKLMQVSKPSTTLAPPPLP